VKSAGATVVAVIGVIVAIAVAWWLIGVVFALVWFVVKLLIVAAIGVLVWLAIRRAFSKPAR
jgi:hypothetical protein